MLFASEYHKGKAKNPKCHSPHIMDADLLMQTIAEVLKKIEDYHRNYSREYRARNLEKQREYDRMKAREYRARRKAQAAAAQPTQ